MTGSVHKLTATFVRQTKKIGMHADGAGLFLQVTRGVSGEIKRSWLVRVRLPGGHTREMGLGPATGDNLSDARDKARDARDLADEGIDPIVDRDMRRRQQAEEAARSITFRKAAETYIETHEASWRNAKHRQQWRNTLATYAYPVLGDLPVQSIDVDLVTKVLDPIWRTKTETASRLRGRIETVIDWAIVRGFREGDNPARWKGYLQRALPARSKIHQVRHQNALAYAELPAFMRVLRADTSIGARALEFAILTAARTNEALGATWDEVDLVREVWTVPAVRMKGGREHRVPLSPRASKLLVEMEDLALARDDNLVFPGQRGGQPLSSMALLMLLRRLKRNDVTTHGFRSTLRDWAAEETVFPREIAEAALAHVSGDKVERAYQRGDYLERRRQLMIEWDRFANGSKPANKAAKRPKHARKAPTSKKKRK